MGFAGSATVRVRSYLSTQHLFAAEHFAKLAAGYEAAHSGKQPQISLTHRAYVMGAVLESAAFLEAFVNELLKDAADGHTGATIGLSEDAIARLKGAWPVIESASIVDKYRMVRVLVDAPPADAGARPHDDVVAVVKFRNWLMHNKPRDVGEDAPDKLIDHVRGRFEENPLLGGSDGRAAWFPNREVSASGARWAADSVRAFAQDFVSAIGSMREHHLPMSQVEP